MWVVCDECGSEWPELAAMGAAWMAESPATEIESVLATVTSFRMSDIGKRLAEADRLEGPRVLYEGWRAGEIDRDGLPELIPTVWRYSEAPAPIGETAWLELFSAVPTPLVEDAEHDVPAFVVKLWRGCHPLGARGFSWTYDLWRAELFAGRDNEARVFEIPYDRSIVLGVFGHE